MAEPTGTPAEPSLVGTAGSFFPSGPDPIRMRVREPWTITQTKIGVGWGGEKKTSTRAPGQFFCREEKNPISGADGRTH